MNPTNLVVVGNGPLLALAVAIATAERGAERIHTVALEPQEIAMFDVSSLGERAPGVTDVFAAIGPAALNFARFDLWAKLKLAGYRCATLVHRSANCDPSAMLADNVLVGAAAVVDAGASVARGSIVNAGSIVGANTTVGAWCWLASGVILGTQSSIGSHSVLGMGVNIADGASINGPCEIDTPGMYRGEWAEGTFLSPEFSLPGARLVRPH